MLYLHHGTAPHASGKRAIKAIIEDSEATETTATGRLYTCCNIQSSVINEHHNNVLDDTVTKGQDMNETAKASKAKEPLTLMTQSVVDGLDRDQFCDLESSEAPADNIESDIDSEVVELKLVTKKMKRNMKDKNKDKVPILNLQDKVRANHKNIPNTGGHLKVQ